MKKLNLLLYIILTVAPLLSGCFASLDERWQAFDAQMRQEIGVKTKAYYMNEWGKPAKRRQTADGREIVTWEFRGYGGAQGWNKILTFGPDGVLKDFQRDYWPKDQG